MDVTFLSVGSWCPLSAEDDTVSLLIDRHILVDTGWMAVRNLLRAGVSVEAVDTLLFTHMHQDHYMALPSLLFYLLNGRHDASGLTVYGPDGVEDIVRQALTFAGKERHYQKELPPTVRRLAGGDGIDFPGVKVRCIPSHHAAPGLCYRFTDTGTGRSLAYSGDTEVFEALAPFASGCEALIHEFSWGARRNNDIPNTARHSSAGEAARVAKDAGVRALYLVHGPRTEGALAAARRVFPNTHLPSAGDVLRL